MSSLTSSLRRRLDLWSTAVREGFMSLLPLTMLGAFAVMATELASLSFVQAHLDIGGIDEVVSWGHRLSIATMGIMGFASAFSISGRATALLNLDDLANAPPQLIVSSLAGAAFVLSVWTEGGGLRELGYQHVLHSIFAGLFTAEVCTTLDRYRRTNAKGLQGLEARALLPQALTASWSAAIVLPLVTLCIVLGGQFGPAISHMVHAGTEVLLQQLALGPTELHILMTAVNQALWQIGVNGGQVLLGLGGQGVLPLTDARTPWSDSLASPMFMNAFGHLGGAGATWGLILASLWRSKDIGMRRLALTSTGPAILNVNELLLFGLPLIFSPVMLVPFLAAPVVNVAVASALVESAVLPLSGHAVVWSTPVFMSGFTLTGTPWGGVLQLVCIIMDALIYAPFLAHLETIRRDRSDREFRQALSVLQGAAITAERVLDRADVVGDTARRLMVEFKYALDHGKVELFYQPQHAADGSVVAVEALTRWHHHRYGQIPVAAVINVAEECEVIHELGDWVLKQACHDLADLQAYLGRPLTMSINMSPIQLESADWASKVALAIAEFQLRPGEIDIEITEGRAMSSSDQADQTLNQLQAIGVQLSMDDFGMGCTSLLYMQRFAVHTIKLDGAVTRDILNSPVNQDIVSAVVRLGRSRGVQIVAEYVEAVDQRNLLFRLGCDRFQGWLYGKAMPLDDLKGYLHHPIQPDWRCEESDFASGGRSPADQHAGA